MSPTAMVSILMDAGRARARSSSRNGTRSPGRDGSRSGGPAMDLVEDPRNNGGVSRIEVRSDGVPPLAGGPPGSLAGDGRQLSAAVSALSREHLLGILESVNEGVITADETQTIVMANRAAAAMFGAEDLIGLPLERLIPDR